MAARICNCMLNNTIRFHSPSGPLHPRGAGSDGTATSVVHRIDLTNGRAARARRTHASGQPVKTIAETAAVSAATVNRIAVADG